MYAFLEFPTEEVNTPYYSLKAYADHSFAYAVWFADVPDAAYRTSVLEVVAIARKHKIQHLLSDSSEIGYITPVTKQWMREVLVPQLVNSGIKKIARIAYNDYLSFLTNHSLLRALPGVLKEKALFELETFTEIDPAIAWLDF